jgi:uncharacterized damage-inducible protein DinB
MTVQALLDRVRNAYDEYSAAIADIPAGMLSAPDTIGSWSVRDVIAHVGADERWMAGQLEALQSSELPTATTPTTRRQFAPSLVRNKRSATLLPSC